VSAIAAELFGLEDGIAAGKGGSMHMYSKDENFYGGAGEYSLSLNAASSPVTGSILERLVCDD
jgi:hypothetical protein